MEQQRVATPLMQQYFTIKERYSDALVLFQVGDFYELFYEDARRAAACLAITLTSRGKSQGEPIPLCGVPVHARDHYVAKLVRAGFCVALCDQLEPAVPGKVVARGVTQLFTPGTLVESGLLDAKNASHIVAIFSESDKTALVACELLTGSIWFTDFFDNNQRTLELELSRFVPDELLVSGDINGKKLSSWAKKNGYYTVVASMDPEIERVVDCWLSAYASNLLMQQLLRSEAAHTALKMLFSYLKYTQQLVVEQLQQISWYQSEDYLIIDPASQRNLELVSNLQDGSSKNTLFELLDGAQTSMGSRLIKKWILRPLLQSAVIEHRLELLTFFCENLAVSKSLQQLIKLVGDVERVVGRVALNRAHHRDYQQLLQALRLLPEIRTLIESCQTPLCKSMVALLVDLSELCSFLHIALEEESDRGFLIRDGFNESLDQMRALIADDASVICKLEQREQAATGISSLKIRYNQIQGYYIEITKANFDLVPADYIRLQTLVGKERFTTPELKQLELRINTARAEVSELEAKLYAQVKDEVRRHLSDLRKISQGLAELDALLGLWKVGYERGYVRPSFSYDNQIKIEAGRHPVIEEAQVGIRFVPNDLLLNKDNAIVIITGPNMGGKSTFLRQAALISIMAQCGSFVPAAKAELSIRDRIFTRIGASDNVAGGKSTFLVEMEETARICQQATQRSLVILDEVGRGTSTFDGLVIAQAVLEYIAHDVQALSLFATHYHELTELAHQEPRIKNYRAQIVRDCDEIIFTYKIEPGVAQGSFGIDAAKIAGLPGKIIERAQSLLSRYVDSR